MRFFVFLILTGLLGACSFGTLTTAYQVGSRAATAAAALGRDGGVLNDLGFSLGGGVSAQQRADIERVAGAYPNTFGCYLDILDETASPALKARYQELMDDPDLAAIRQAGGLSAAVDAIRTDPLHKRYRCPNAADS